VFAICPFLILGITILVKPDIFYFFLGELFPRQDGRSYLTEIIFVITLCLYLFIPIFDGARLGTFFCLIAFSLGNSLFTSSKFLAKVMKVDLRLFIMTYKWVNLIYHRMQFAAELFLYITVSLV